MLKNPLFVPARQVKSTSENWHFPSPIIRQKNYSESPFYCPKTTSKFGQFSKLILWERESFKENWFESLEKVLSSQIHIAKLLCWNGRMRKKRWMNANPTYFHFSMAVYIVVQYNRMKPFGTKVGRMRRRERGFCGVGRTTWEQAR